MPTPKTALQRNAEEQIANSVVASLDMEVMQASELLTGYNPLETQDSFLQRLNMAQHVMKQSGNLTLKPFLPLLLSIRGKPYHLDDHFPFSPFFRTRMPRTTLLKTGRQVSKSTSLAAQGVLFSNCIPYFSTLYITPLFEMIRRFSQNYVAPFIETSPVGKLFSGQNTMNNVLQRSFKNRSQMIFSFAYLDAERTRGISADKNCLLEGTPVELLNGSLLPIEKVEPGMCIVSADKDGIIVEDIVTEKIYQGVQDVFEVEFSNGAIVRCTANERFRQSNGEWIYLQSLFAGSSQTYRSSVELIPNTDAVGLFVRGCIDFSVQSNFGMSHTFSTWKRPSRILSSQSRKDKGLCNYRSGNKGKSRLGRSRRVLQHCLKSCLQRYRQNGTTRGKKENNYGLGSCVKLGIDSILGYGRWNEAEIQYSFLHSSLLQKRSRSFSSKITGDGIEICNDSCSQSERSYALYNSTQCRRFPQSVLPHQSLDPSGIGIQVNPTTTNSNLWDLSVKVQRATRSGQSLFTCVQESAVSESSSSQIMQNKYDGRTQTKKAGKSKTEICTEKAKCEIATIIRVTAIGKHRVWDINTQKEHAFFASGVLCHNCIDEIQDMDISFLPIIHETISASREWGLIQYAGTPKTLDNTIEKLWTDSSMAEWVIKCPSCNHWNIPALEFDLIQMIGPVREDITDNCPGTVCAKCRKVVNPRPSYQGGTGRWVHRFPDKRWTFAGYHVPQIIMPMHYGSIEKWQKLVDKKEGKGNVPINVFYNEVCGESWDSGAKIVTVTDLKKAACLPWHNVVDEAKEHLENYLIRFVAVDWGGGGVNKGKSDLALQSYTSIAVLGLTPDGRVDVIYGYRSMRPHDHIYEARIILGMMNTFRCSHVVHDYTGAGTVRETVLVQAGLSLNNILPVAYIGPAKGGLILYKPPTRLHPRGHYAMDRNRALNYCCQFIKSGIVRFFQYDYKGTSDVGLLHDFLNLIEDKTDTGIGKSKYKILRDPSGPDDFAQAVTMGTMMIYQMHGKWPNMAAYEDVEVSEDVIMSTRGTVQSLDWI